jgi:Acetyltransferases
MDYTAAEYYNVTIGTAKDGFSVNMHKELYDSPVTHTSEEYNYPDRLYEDHWDGAFAWGVININDGRLIAAIETCPEDWSNRLMVTELWVDENFRRKGLAHALMAVAKEQVRHERRRALTLETQSCNMAAIAFYLKEGFTLIGFDSCCYSNNDLERREVRLDLGWFPVKYDKVTTDDIVVRPERPYDWHDTEYMTKKAFLE